MHTYRRFPWARTSILVAHRKLRLNKHSMDKTAEKRKTMVVITCIAVDSVVWNKARSVPSLSAGHFSASQLDNFGGAHWAAEYITGYRMRFPFCHLTRLRVLRFVWGFLCCFLVSIVAYSVDYSSKLLFSFSFVDRHESVADHQAYAKIYSAGTFLSKTATSRWILQCRFGLICMRHPLRCVVNLSEII
jgi:hypothetical protein